MHITIKLISVVSLLMLLTTASFSEETLWGSTFGACNTITVVAGLDTFINAKSYGEMAVSFEPDTIGTDTSATVTLQACSTNAVTSCVDYDYDSDGDGVPDTNILDGLAIQTTGVRGIVGINHLRVQIGSAPSGTDSPTFTFCWGQ
tara:strand:+ start:691 stop:1128 length:438 start_codon:yes stop_codon:yes gene_type:complete